VCRARSLALDIACDQRGNGSRSNKAQTQQVSAAAMIRWICGCQPAKAASCSIDCRAGGPVLAVPGVVLGPADEIQQVPA
jgi:hypothetical protein